MAPPQTNRILLAVGLDISLTLLALWLAAQLRLALPFGRELNEPGVELGVPVYALAALIWVVVLAQFNLYSRRRARFRDESRALVLAVGTALLILAGALYLSFREVSRLQFVYFGLIDLALLQLAHAARFVRRARMAGRNRWRVVVAGTGAVARELAGQLRAQATRGMGVELAGCLAEDEGIQGHANGVPVIGSVGEAAAVVSREHISEIILALPRDAHDQMLALVANLEELPVQVSLAPDVLDLAWFMTRVEDLNGIPLLRLRESPLDGPARAVKRVIDIVLASALLVVSGPLLLVIGALVKLSSPGPVLLRQQRVGENGRLFGMLKFRTMRVAEQGSGGAEERESTGAQSSAHPQVRMAGEQGSGGAQTSAHPQMRAAGAEEELHKRRDDPRVTRVGRVLRHFSLDELPQFINVVKGDMSLVGPRPEMPWLVDRYETWQRRRFAVPPGMTGWWQVNGRSDRPMHLHVEDDLYYIRHYSLWLDFVILLRTIPVVLSGKGAY